MSKYKCYDCNEVFYEDDMVDLDEIYGETLVPYQDGAVPLPHTYGCPFCHSDNVDVYYSDENDDD